MSACLSDEHILIHECAHILGMYVPPSRTQPRSVTRSAWQGACSWVLQSSHQEACIL